jgi:hypothetical protein
MPEKIMRRIIAPLVATAVLTSNALAIPDTNGALPPGKPAGVKQADLGGDGFWYLTGVVVLIGAVVILASDNGKSGGVSGTTAGTQ